MTAAAVASLFSTAFAAPDLAGIVGWAADKVVQDGQDVGTMSSWRYVDCGELDCLDVSFDDDVESFFSSSIHDEQVPPRMSCTYGFNHCLLWH